MSIEAMKKAMAALESCAPADTSSGHVIYPSFDEKLVDQACEALRTAIQQAEAQQPATTEPAGYLYDFKYDDEIVRDWFTQNIDEIQFRPATCLNIRPLYAHPAPGVPDALKDHQIAAMVNSLRDIARQFHGHDSLRERIANVLVPALKAEAKTDEPVAFGIRESSTGRICQFVSSDDEDEVAQLGEYRKGIVVPLYTHPAPGVPDDVARDADRYRWLRRKACVIGKTTYCGEETGQPILDFVNLPDVTEVIRRDSASTLDAAIDAAMLTAAQAQKGGE